MSTAGSLVINLALNTIGITAGLAGVKSQLDAFQSQVAGQAAASQAAAAAARVTAAQNSVAIATDRVNLANMKATASTSAVALATARLAEVNTSASVSDNVRAAAAQRVTNAEISRVAAQNAVRASTIALEDAQISLTAAERLAANPPALKSNMFPLVTAAATLAGLAVLRFGESSIKAAADFEYEMRLIQTQANAGAGEVAHMSQAVLDMAANVQAGPEELAKGLYHVESVGYRGAKALDILKTAAEGAAVGNADLESVTNALVGSIATGIKGTEDYAQTMGILNATVGTGNLRMQDLATSFSSGILATAKQFGLGLKDVGAALATMSDQSIPAEEGSTRLRITIALLGAPTKIAASNLARIGLSSRDLADTMRGPDGLLGTLTLLRSRLDATFGSDDVGKAQLLKNAFGGSRSSAGIMTLTSTSSLDLLIKKYREIDAGKNTFAERFQEESQTAEAAFRNLGAAVDVLRVNLGNSILGPVTLLAQVMANVAKQGIIMIPLFGALTAAMTVWATVSTVNFIKSMLDVTVTWINQKREALSTLLAYGETSTAAAGLAAAQAELAAATKAMTPLLVEETAALTENADVVAANIEALQASAALITDVGGAATIAAAEFEGMTASLEGNLLVMRQTAATAPTLVAGIAGMNGAMAVESTGMQRLIIGTQTATGAQEALAGSTGPVVTGLEAQTVASTEAAAAMERYALAQKEVAVQQALVTAETAANTGIFAGIQAAFMSGGALAGFKAIGTAVGGVIGKAIPGAIIGVLGFGIGDAIYNAIAPQLNKQASDLVENTKKFVSNASVSQLQTAKTAYETALSQTHGGKGPDDGFYPISDLFDVEKINELKGGLKLVTDQLDAAAKAGGVQVGGGFADGLANGLDAVANVTQSLAQQFGSQMSSVEDAAAQLGGDDMAAYAKSLSDARQLPVDEFGNLVTALKNQMTPTAEIARLMGELSSTQLAEGLASKDPDAVAAAEALRKHVVERLDSITGGAFTAGTDAGATWQDAFVKSLTSSGLDEATAEAKLADVLGDPTKIAAAEQKWDALKQTWQKVAPTAAQVSAALKDLTSSLVDTTSIADQSSSFIAMFRDNLQALDTLGETAGAELMGDVAKGIKDQRDAPLNALKELHGLMQDEFDKNREIALLYAELTSKDLTSSLTSGDSVVRAAAIHTRDIITQQLDYLTQGAYSRSLGAGAATAQGLADSSGAVTSGAVAAVSGVGAVLDATVGYGGRVGEAAGMATGAGLASTSNVVSNGAAAAVAGVGSVFTALKDAAAKAGWGGGAGVAGGLASQAGTVLSGAQAMLAPVLEWLGKVHNVLVAVGKVFGLDFGTAITEGAQAAVANAPGFSGGGALGAASASALKAAQSTQSWADILKNALGSAGDMAKYLNDQLNGVTNTVASSKAAITTAFADIKASAEQYFQALHEKNLQAIQDSHDQKNALLDAKEALNQKPVTAAQKALDFQRKAQEEWRLRKAVSEATDPASRRDAILALQDFLAQKHIDMMQDEVDNAKLVIEAQKKHNDDMLALQKKGEDDRYNQQKKDFDRNLAALQRYLNTHPAEWRKVQGEVLALLGKYGVDYKSAGSLLGGDFVTGLRSQIKAAYQAAKDLAAAGAGVPPASLPPAPAVPPTLDGRYPGLQDVVPPSGGGAGHGGIVPIPLASGSWQILKDNLLARLHKDEMVLPRDVADLVRSIGGSSSPFQTIAGTSGTPALGSPSLGRPDASGGVSVSRGGGGTLIVKIGEQTVAEITDRNLSIQDDIYGRPRVSTRSGR